MITPFFQGVIQLFLYLQHDFRSQGKNLGLLFSSYKTANRTLNGSHERGGKTFLVHKFKGHILYGFLLLVEHRKEQHSLKVYICLIDGGCLKLQFNRTVLY